MSADGSNFVRLFGEIDPDFVPGIPLHVGERRLGVVMPSELLQLLLYTPTTLDSELEVLPQLPVAPLIAVVKL